MGKKGDGKHEHGADADDRLTRTTISKAPPDPAGRMSLVRHEVHARTRSNWCPTRTIRLDLRVDLPEPPCDFTPQQSATDPGRRRADLPSPALLPDRHGGQVRGHAVDRPGRRLLRPRGPLRPHGFYGPCEPHVGLPLPGAPAAARPGHPGRVAPDLRADGHDGRPVRIRPG